MINCKTWWNRERLYIVAVIVRSKSADSNKKTLVIDIIKVYIAQLVISDSLVRRNSPVLRVGIEGDRRGMIQSTKTLFIIQLIDRSALEHPRSHSKVEASLLKRTVFGRHFSCYPSSRYLWGTIWLVGRFRQYLGSRQISLQGSLNMTTKPLWKRLKSISVVDRNDNVEWRILCCMSIMVLEKIKIVYLFNEFERSTLLANRSPS